MYLSEFEEIDLQIRLLFLYGLIRAIKYHLGLHHKICSEIALVFMEKSILFSEQKVIFSAPCGDTQREN